MSILEKAEELWDRHSGHIEDNSFGFDRVAGTDMMSREQFMEAIKALSKDKRIITKQDFDDVENM